MRSASGMIGGTPLLDISRLFSGSQSRVLAKLELANLTSIKDRAVLGMIRVKMQSPCAGDIPLPGAKVLISTKSAS